MKSEVVDRLRTKVPACLCESPHWVVWRRVERGGKATKIPFNARTGEPADSTDPSTWSSFEEAMGAFQADDRCAGIGFVFYAACGFAGVDLDGCIEDGQVAPEAQAIIDLLNSYTEVSPSGRGVKVFLVGRKPASAGCRCDLVEGMSHLEVYDDKRFFVVTGDHMPGTPPTVEDRQGELSALCDRFWPTRSGAVATSAAEPASEPAGSAARRSVPQIDMATREARCKAYLEKCPDAISGQGGHNVTLRAACECFRFGLDEGAAASVMRWFNNGKTGAERWSDKELDHKLESARHKVDAAGEFGVRLIDIRRDPSAMRPEQIAALMTDVGNAARLVKRYGNRIRFSYGPQQWLTWDGRRWKPDDRGAIVKLCKQTALAILDEAEHLEDKAQRALVGWAMASQRRDRLSAMAALAQPDVGVGPDELDADPWAFNCLNGTIDLRTGALRPHCQDDLITKLAPVECDPHATCPRFDRFLQEVFASDDELTTFVQRWHGHCLTGDVREQYLLIYYGQGNNGKNVLLDTVSAVMGDYAGEAPPDLVTVRKHPEHPTEIADLLGKRLVVASETERDAELRLQFVKRITGNARLKARRMREDYFEFTRTHKMILVSNNRPAVREDTEAVWRRLRLVPFNVVIPPAQRDPTLLAKLRPEWPGILTWMVRGCVDWLRDGLTEPAAVVFATKEFRGNATSLDGFLRDCCTIELGSTCVTAELHAAYADWCGRHRRIPLERRAFAAALKEKGCSPDKIQGRWHWVGLRLDRTESWT